MQEFIEFCAGVMGVDPSEVSEDTARGQQGGWNSLMHMRLVMEIEDEYDVEIPINEIPEIFTIRDFYKYIQD